MLDFVLDVVGYTAGRVLLPILSFGKIQVDGLTSDEIGFNWLGFKRLPDGKLLCSAETACWIGILFWALVLVIVLWAIAVTSS